MPDVSIMMQLCEILGISVNELLKGEKIAMEQYEENAEMNLMRVIGNVEKKINENKILKFIIIILVIVMIIFSYIAGADVGDALGEFIYNLSH